MEELSRGETGFDLSIRSILLGPCGRHWGGKGQNGNQEAREEFGAEIQGFKSHLHTDDAAPEDPSGVDRLLILASGEGGRWPHPSWRSAAAPSTL